MAMTKDEFISVLHNKTLKELDDWAYNWYKTASDRQEEIERLKKQKASETVKETNKKLREENNKLKAKLAKISTLTSSNVVVADAVDADAQ
jgi:regulator of replication initiation timing